MTALRLSISAALLLLAGCSEPSLTGPCENTEVSRVTAPDGHHDAVLFERSCGVATGFSSQVSVVGRGLTVEGAGNVVVLDDDEGAAPAAAWGGPDVDLGWTAADQLVVRHHPSARVLEGHARVAGVAVIRVGDLEDRSSLSD